MGVQAILLWAAAISVVFAMLARLYMQTEFRRHMQAVSRNGKTGSEAVKAVLEYYGLADVEIVECEGAFNDRYVPGLGALMISAGAYSSARIAAVASLLFETARAVQYQRGLGWILRFRRLGFRLFYLLCYAAVACIAVLCVIGRFDLLGYPAAVLLCGFVLALLSLPLDWNAMDLAGKGMESTNLFLAEEMSIAKRLLRACALTYVASSYDALRHIVEIPKNLIAGICYKGAADKVS